MSSRAPLCLARMRRPCPSWPDFTTPTRQLTLPQPTDEPETLAEAALRLFHQTWTGEQAVRLIGMG